MNSQYQSAKCSIQSWNKSWTIEDEQCQKIGGGYKTVKFRFLLFSLSGANILSTPIQNPIPTA